MVEIGVKMRKVVIFTVKGCYRLVCNHLFLVGMLCFLILLYRSFPCVFSVLVSASPVLVCTAALLGTLLSFGQPNIPEIEKEERTTHEIVSLKAGFLENADVAQRNENCSVERFSDNERDVVEKSIEGTSLVVDGINKVGSEGSFAGFGQQIEERSREVQFNDRAKEETQTKLQGFEFEQKNEMFEVGVGDRKSVENQYSLISDVDDENLELENDRSPVGSVDSKVVNVDSLDSPPGSPWKHVDEEEEEEDEDDETFDSGSDRAESSSPDASMADILPMLDELHPLLDEDAPQPANLSHDGSDAASESARSSESSNESDDDTENQEESEVADDENDDDEEETLGEKEDQTKSAITWTEEDQRNLLELGSSELERNRRLENLLARRRARGDTENQEEFEVADDDNEDGEDEEETQGEKEDQTKSAITWTEEDQRNLMELGSSELERNRRLENLIARRRARKTMSMMTEKNLIDLEGADLPFSVPPITTTRTNPFDLPHDSYENMGLPPIPGSAPSVLLPRRNPFDLPYDSSEEKPDLMEDGFQEEFVPFQSKESFFRRHESFHVRPSPFGINRAEKRTTRLRPYFIPERMGSEETSYSSFQRQSSDLSDSKVSSVPDTESIGSAGDLEERSVTEEEISMEVRNHTEEDMSQEPELISMIEHVPENIVHGSVTEEDTSVAEVRNHAEEDMSQEPELISMMEHVPEHIGHGSESSEEEDTLEFGQVEKRHVEVDEIEIKLRDVENHHETEPSLVPEQSSGNPLEANSTEIHAKTEAVEQRYGGVSSLSSLSEESEIHAEKEAEELPSFVVGGDHIEEPSISTQPSVPGSHLNVTTPLTDDNPHKEPVYDSSPQAVRKNISSSSISSDLHVESEYDLPPVVVKRTVSFGERESEVRSRDMENDTPVDKEMLAGSSQTHPVDKSEMESRGNVEITECDVIPPGSSHTHSVDENEMRSEGVVEITEHDIVKYDFSAVDGISDGITASVDHETVPDHTSVDAKSSRDTSRKENLMYADVASQQARSFDNNTHVGVPDNVQSVSGPSNEQNLTMSEEAQHSGNVEQVSPVRLGTLSPRSQSTADHLTVGGALLSEQGIVQSNSDSFHHEADETLTPANHQHPLTEKSVPLSTEELVLSDKSMVRPPGKDHKEALMTPLLVSRSKKLKREMMTITQEPSITMVESVLEVSTSHNWNHSDVQELHHNVSPDMDMPTISNSITVPSEVFETQAPAVDEANEILEIDEELLSELDTVGDFCVKELGEFDDHVELGGQILSAQHDAKSFTGLVEGNSTQAHEAEYGVHTEHHDAAIKEPNEYDKDMKFVSELESSGTSAVEQVDTRQHDQREVDTIDLESTEASKEKEVDVAENILKHNSDAEGTNSTMPEIEARSIKDIESIFHKAVSTSVETEAVLRNPESSCVEPSLEDTAARCSEDGEVDNFSSQSKVTMETTNSEEKLVKDFDLDLNQLPEDDVEQIPITDSVPNAARSKDKEGTSQGLHVLEIAAPDNSNLAHKQASESFPSNDSNLALKQASDISPKDVLKSSEDVPAKDVANDVVSSKTAESDVHKSTKHAPEKPDDEVKTPEG